MPAKSANTKPAGSLPTRWALRTYEVRGTAKDGWDMYGSYGAGEVELRIPQTRFNVGVEWHVCRNPECPGNNPCGHVPSCAFGAHRRESHGVIPTKLGGGDESMDLCPECFQSVSLESQEFIGAYPTDRQIKRAFGVTCRIETDGDDLHIEVTRARDGYPIGRMECLSHASLSPVRVAERTEVQS